MLRILLSKELKTNEKERILKEEFSFTMNDSMKEENDTMCSIADSIERNALAKGFIKGKMEGKTEGKEERTIEIAKRMLDAKFSLEDIVTITKLSKNEIQKLTVS